MSEIVEWLKEAESEHPDCADVIRLAWRVIDALDEENQRLKELVPGWD